MQKRKPGQPHKGWKAAAIKRHADPIRIGQQVVRNWCVANKVAIDAFIAVDLAARISAAIFEYGLNPEK